MVFASTSTSSHRLRHLTALLPAPARQPRKIQNPQADVGIEGEDHKCLGGMSRRDPASLVTRAYGPASLPKRIDKAARWRERRLFDLFVFCLWVLPWNGADQCLTAAGGNTRR